MALKVNMHGDVAVMTIKGKLMGGPDTKAIHDKVKELVDEDQKKIVIDLAGVKWMKTSSLLCRCYSQN